MTTDVPPGLAGVAVVETRIAEPDSAGSNLRYRGVPVDALAGSVPFEQVWGLLVADRLSETISLSDMVPATFRSGDIRVDMQAGVAGLGSRLRSTIDQDRDSTLRDLKLASAALIGFAAQSARGSGSPVPQREIAYGRTVAEQFLIAWRGEADEAQAAAIEDYWITAAEHGLNASTFTARVVASTGADVGAVLSAAVGSLSGPLHGGAPSRALSLIEDAHNGADPSNLVQAALDRGERLMGFGHPVYRAEDPRARVLRESARRLRMPKYEAALAVETAAIEALRERKPDRILATNVDYWAAVVLDFVDIPAELFTPLFACARTAGWSAHVLEQVALRKIFRPSAKYVGEADRSIDLVDAK